MDPKKVAALFEKLTQEKEPGRRKLLALGILSERLREEGIEPILVGGAAVEFYTAGGYATGDVDLALPLCPEVDEAFADLGFSKEGRFWLRRDLDLLFEAPAPAGLPGETAPRTVIEIEGLRVVILGIEDLLMDRLRGWVHWQSQEDHRWTRRLALLYADRLDWRYLFDHSEYPEEEQALSELKCESEAGEEAP